MIRRALFVGVEDYDDVGIQNLAFCKEPRAVGRVYHRRDSPGYRYSILGFRLCCSAEPPK